jgi:hypothetical protein
MSRHLSNPQYGILAVCPKIPKRPNEEHTHASVTQISLNGNLYNYTILQVNFATQEPSTLDQLWARGSLQFVWWSLPHRQVWNDSTCNVAVLFYAANIVSLQV